MGDFFTRERFGRPQVFAGCLLLVFTAQCFWLLLHGTHPQDVDASELFRVQEGLRQWQGGPVAGTPAMERLEAAAPVPMEIDQNEGYDPDHSPLWYLIAAVTLQHGQEFSRLNSIRYWAWLARLPYMVFGVLLGASLWYVARRLYGNAGGYVALTLYCFSPAILRSSTLWSAEPEMGAAWGTFGAVFTAIAVAHTLYAPREVVLWNWRRIFLLGLSLALAIGCQFSLIVLVPITLGFMLYVAPARQVAALAIWASACAVGLVLLCASYGFHFGVFWQGLRHAHFFGIAWRAFGMPGVYRQVFVQIEESGPALLIAVPVVLIAYIAWARTRYFGNTAPLLVAALFLVLGMGMPHNPGLHLMTVPFLFVFVAGIAADLLETPYRSLVAACLTGLLAASGFWNLIELARIAPK